MRSRHIVAIILALNAPAAAIAAQPIPRDSIAIEQARTLVELSRGYYWIDRRATSGVEQCQIRISDICLAEHLTNYGTQPVEWGNGYPRRFRVVVPDSGEVQVMIPDRLQEIADSAADNVWALGHLAYLYSQNAGLTRALDAVRGCRGNRGWCAALQGFVFHSYSQFAAADSMYRIALAAMPESERCRWRDISLLLDEANREAYQRLTCEQRAAVEDRIWWLADPLYSVPGNDRRTEHFSRRVVDSLMTGARTPFYLPRPAPPSLWDRTLGDIVLRFGMASHWIVPGKLTTYEEGRVRWIHYHTPSYQFLPHRLSLTGDGAILRDDFRLDIPLDSARERYHPAYDYVTDLVHSQTVVFPRGDSMIVAAGMDITREPYNTGGTGPFTASLYLARDHAAAPTMRVVRNVTGRAVINATVPRDDVLIGLEAMSQPLQMASRTRFTLTPAPRPRPGEVWTTQPLLFSATSNLPRRASEAIPIMLGSEKIVMGRPIGIFWEVGGAARNTVARFTIRAVRTDERRPGLLDRVTGIFRTSIASDTLVVSWSDPVGPDAGVSGHSILLDVGSLAAGNYSLELDVDFPGGIRATSRRAIELIERDDAARDLMDVLKQPVPKERPGETTTRPAVRRRQGPVVPPS